MRRSRGSTCHSMPNANLCKIIAVKLPRISAMVLRQLGKRDLSGRNESSRERRKIFRAPRLLPVIQYSFSPDLDFSEFTLSSIFEISRSDTFCCHHQSHNPVTFVTGSIPRDSGGKYRKPGPASFSIPFSSQPADGPDELVAPSQLFTM